MKNALISWLSNPVVGYFSTILNAMKTKEAKQNQGPK
jgi:hypothetical protein